MKIQYDSSIKDDKRTRLENEVPDFYEIFEPIEKVIYLLMDKVTGAVFCECHVSAKNLINNCTVDVPLDPEEQSDYRANRELVEDSSAFAQMKIDAINGRIFSNIVAEYNVEFDEEHPLKIVGGQHRIKAIQGAVYHRRWQRNNTLPFTCICKRCIRSKKYCTWRIKRIDIYIEESHSKQSIVIGVSDTLFLFDK